MRLRSTLLLLLAAVAVCTSALAAPVVSSPSSSPPPANREPPPRRASVEPTAIPPAVPLPTQVSPRSVSSNEAACVVVLGAAMYAGTKEITAGTVCNALRRRGARVGPVVHSAAGYRAAYVMRIEPFGRSWFLAVTYEEPVGNPVKMASVQIELSDLPRGAEVLADAQMGKDSRPRTQRIPGRSTTEVEPMVDFGVTVDGWLGGGGGSFGGGGFATGVTGLLQYKWLDAGLGASIRSGLLTPTTSFVNGLAGVRVDTVPWFRIDLLAETGAQMVSGAGTSIFSGTLRGGSATLPYLGGRVGFSFLIGRSHHFVLGWWAILGSSLGHRTTLATVETCFFGCNVTTNTYSVGGSTFMTGLRLGAFIY